MASPTISGLSGFDSSSLISQLVSIASQPLTDISNKQSLVDSANSTLSSFSSQLGNLKSAAAALSTSSGFSSMTASSSDTGIVASASGSPVASSYTINVTQLAKAQKMRSDAQTSAGDALGQAGTLTLQVGSGTATSLNIAATDSLSDVASKINGLGLRVSASIINAGGSYRLSLQGLDTGASNAITVTEGSGVSLGLSNSANLVQSAQDAQLTVDGLAITRPTNSITGAIDGVTLALTNTTSAPATVNVTPDSTALKTKINTFISAYNAVVSTVHTTTGYGTIKATNSELAGDSAMRRTLDQISASVTGVIAGASGTYSSLSMVGVKHNTDGTMSFDSDTFDTAIQKDSASVRRLFVTDTSTGATGVMKGLSTLVDGIVNDSSGAIKNRITSLASEKTRLQTEYDSQTTRITAYQTQLKAQYAALDQAMSKYSAMSSALASLTTSSSSG